MLEDLIDQLQYKYPEVNFKIEIMTNNIHSIYVWDKWNGKELMWIPVRMYFSRQDLKNYISGILSGEIKSEYFA